MSSIIEGKIPKPGQIPVSRKGLPKATTPPMFIKPCDCESSAVYISSDQNPVSCASCGLLYPKLGSFHKYVIKMDGN